MAAKFNVYEEITQRFLDQLSQGVIPWQKPWKIGKNMDFFPAFSYVNKKRYDILNQMLLDFEPGEYITFNQCKKLGGHVKKGEKGHFIVGWIVENKQRKNEDGTPMEDDKGNPVTYKTFALRKYYVFNVLTQVEGLDPKMDWTDIEDTDNFLQPCEVAEQIIDNYIHSADGPQFEAKISDRAFYSPAFDSVTVPSIKQYENIAEYYSTAFHELTHSTMKSTRCNREEDRKGKKVSFGSEEYSKEELVAEIGAASLVNYCGLETEKSFNNSASYIEGWSKALKDQPKMIVYASAQAQKAIDYILNAVKDPQNDPSGTLNDEDKETVDYYINTIFDPVNDLHANIELLKDEKVFSKFEKMEAATVNFIDVVYTFKIDNIKAAATELKRSVSNFGYDASKVDKAASNSINNFKYKKAIDDLVIFIDNKMDPDREDRETLEAWEAIAELEAL